MPIQPPDALKPYWGPIQAAASARANTAGAFEAVREAAANAGLSLEGIDAISMGAAYSAAVQQRNAAESLQGSIQRLQAAEGATRDLFYNQAIDSSMITPVTPWTSTLGSDVMPSFAIRFQVEVPGEAGPVTEFRQIDLGNEIPQTVGQINDLIQSVNDIQSEEYGVTQTPTGFASILIK